MKDWENAKIDCESDFGNKNNQLRTGYFFYPILFLHNSSISWNCRL